MYRNERCRQRAAHSYKKIANAKVTRRIDIKFCKNMDDVEITAEIQSAGLFLLVGAIRFEGLDVVLVECKMYPLDCCTDIVGM